MTYLEVADMIYEFLLDRRYDKQKFLKFSMWRKIIKFHFSYMLNDYHTRKVFELMKKDGFFINNGLDRQRRGYMLFNPCAPVENKNSLIVSFN